MMQQPQPQPQHPSPNTFSSATSSNTRAAKAPLSVSFSPNVTMRWTRHIKDYYPREIDACFYQDADYVEFKKESKRIAKMMELKQYDVDDEINDTTTRGVEFLTRDGFQRKCQNRRMAWKVVMREQIHQLLLQEEDIEEQHDKEKQQGQYHSILDDEKIASAYAQVTRTSETLAYLRGISDEMIAFEQKNPQPKYQTLEQQECESRTTSHHTTTASSTAVVRSVVMRVVSTEKIQRPRCGGSNYAAYTTRSTTL